MGRLPNNPLFPVGAGGSDVVGLSERLAGPQISLPLPVPSLTSEPYGYSRE